MEPFDRFNWFMAGLAAGLVISTMILAYVRYFG